MLHLNLALPCPHFYSQGDEDRFFACFYALPEYVAVTGRLETLTLALKAPLSRESFRDLVALFHRYKLSLTCLKPALASLSPGDLAYFMSTESIYQKGLFEA